VGKGVTGSGSSEERRRGKEKRSIVTGLVDGARSFPNTMISRITKRLKKLFALIIYTARWYSTYL